MAKKNDENIQETAENSENVSREEYERVLAELEELKGSKKEDKTIEESGKLMEETVNVRIPRDPTGKEDDVYISVNGRAMRIKRGVNVRIPKAYALVLEASEEQRDYALGYANEAAEAVK